MKLYSVLIYENKFTFCCFHQEFYNFDTLCNIHSSCKSNKVFYKQNVLENRFYLFLYYWTVFWFMKTNSLLLEENEEFYNLDTLCDIQRRFHDFSLEFISWARASMWLLLTVGWITLAETNLKSSDMIFLYSILLWTIIQNLGLSGLWNFVLFSFFRSFHVFSEDFY